MPKILISILSDYLQPNFLLIKELEGQYDQLMFISTTDMEKNEKGKNLEIALGIPENTVSRIVVVEDDLDAIKSELCKQGFNNKDRYILNITGGTKVMSIAVYDYFQAFNAVYYYVPIGKNVIKELYRATEIALRYRLNLLEYFALNGLRYESDNTLMYSEIHTQNLFNRFKNTNFNRYKVPEILNAQTLSDNKDKRYYGGEWFEEYAYSRLKRENNLADDAICKGAKIFRKKSTENDNEIDVMFVKENKLHIFECKVSMFGNPNVKANTTIENYLYKLAAIAKDFGLRVNSYLLTLHNIYHSNRLSDKSIEMLQKRKNILGIKGLLDCSDFKKQTLNI